MKGALTRVDREQRYGLDEAVVLAAELAKAKFDETIELAVRLGVDPRQADQNVRGTVVLPHGTGRSVRVAVFAKGEKEREAKEAGADVVGGEDLVKRIQDEGWLEFDSAVATPDMMGLVGRIGKVLGPRGLMPNPKLGTVTFDVGKAVQRAQGRQDRVPRRQGGHRASAVRQGVVRRREAAGQRQRGARQPGQGEARLGEGQLHHQRVGELDDGPRHQGQSARGAHARGGVRSQT